MINSYQERQRIQSPVPGEDVLATVGTVYTDGVTLVFPGETTPSQKRYKKNIDVAFKAGDRVLITKTAGTYIVICRIS